MVLATADGDGQPDARFVLVRGIDAAGFVFHTNYDSPKSRQVGANPRGAGVFAWLDLHRQVRVRGPMERVSDAESDAYFASRPRDSQIGAWASPQSEVLADRADLDRRIAADRRRVRRPRRHPARLLGWMAPRRGRDGVLAGPPEPPPRPRPLPPRRRRGMDRRATCAVTDRSAALGEADARHLAGRRVRQRGDRADVGGVLERLEIGRLPGRRRWVRRWRTGAGRGPARRIERRAPRRRGRARTSAPGSARC